MAKVLNYESQIQQGEIVQSWHVSQSVDAFTGAEDYAISISGSVNLTSSFSIAPGNLLTTGQCQYLSYNPTTGQVFRADTASLDSKMHDVFMYIKQDQMIIILYQLNLVIIKQVQTMLL